jgi:outer membrane protein OmpA-like peptidoglycan-associated protein
MHRLLAIVLAAACLFMALPSAAQERVEYRDDFDADRGEWSVGETEDGSGSSQVVSGIYRMAENEDKGFRLRTRNVVLGPDRNWSIRARMRQSAGSTDKAFGLVFWAGDNDNFYEFVVRLSGQVRIRQVRKGFFEDIVEWRDAGALKAGQWVDLELRRVHDALTAFVNGAPIGTMTTSYYQAFGQRHGFILREKVTVDADQFEIVSWPMALIRVVDGVDTTVRAVNLGSIVNSKGDESVDCLAPDGSMLFFSRKDHPGNVAPTSRRDVWVTKRGPDGGWLEPVNLGPPINNARHNYAVAVTQDLNTLFLQGHYLADGAMGQGISYVSRTSTGWSAPINMVVHDYVNRSNIVNSHISSDGSVLFMSLEGPDSRGGNDIYMSRRRSDGSWDTPVNLGDSINTVGMELGPFIAADGTSLYFASNGHAGYGGRDIFVSRRLDSTWRNWSRAMNLGRGINTDEHESFFNVSAKGDSAYFGSQKGSLGQDDIFSIKMPEGAKPEALLLVRGIVIDATKRVPVEAAVIYEDLETGKVAGIARSSPTDGAYRVTLKAGVRYGVRAQAEGYYALSEELDTRELQEYKEVERDLELSPIVVNVAIRLNNVFFDSGKWDLRPESFPELDRLADFMRTNPSLEIHIGGHTDDVGKDADNHLLSHRRADAVRVYVQSKGIEERRLSSEGYGETKPVADNATDEGRQLNRRVEFTITKK